MELLTREDVRRMSDNGTRGPVVVDRDQKLTPGARDWLAAHKIQAVFPAGRDDPAGPAAARYRTLFGASLNEKPEHMTHLRGNILVFKDHPRIAFRGMIDALEGELMLAQQAARAHPALVDELGGIEFDVPVRMSRWGSCACAAMTPGSCGNTPTTRTSTWVSPTSCPPGPTGPPCWR